jgi:hypothetical protein
VELYRNLNGYFTKAVCQIARHFGWAVHINIFYRNSAWRAISNNADDVGQHVSTITGTTTAFGILGSEKLVVETRPVSAICTSHGNTLVIPFRNGTVWAFSIIDATNLSLRTNTADVTIEVIFANEYNLAKYSG